MVEPGISNCKQRDDPKTQESLRFGNHLTTSVFWRYGAPEKNKLEPYECVLGLEELKNWSADSKSEPEVFHKLMAFTEAAAGVSDQPSASPDTPPAPEPLPRMAQGKIGTQH